MSREPQTPGEHLFASILEAELALQRLGTARTVQEILRNTIVYQRNTVRTQRLMTQITEESQ